MCYFCLVALTVCDGGLHIPARPSSLQQATNIDVQKELSVAGPAALQGGLSLAQLKVRAGKTIALPSGASAFVTVADDGADEANELTVAAPADGQLLVVCNHDAQPLSGVAVVPLGSCALLVHDFESMAWSRVDAAPPVVGDAAGQGGGDDDTKVIPQACRTQRSCATCFPPPNSIILPQPISPHPTSPIPTTHHNSTPPHPSQELRGVTALHAAGDLSIGDAHTFAAGRLQVRVRPAPTSPLSRPLPRLYLAPASTSHLTRSHPRTISHAALPGHTARLLHRQPGILGPRGTPHRRQRRRRHPRRVAHGPAAARGRLGRRY